jgi:hypothetical protein
MNISYIQHIELLEELSRRDSDSLEFVILITGALDTDDKQSLFWLLREAVRVLKNGGLTTVIKNKNKVLPKPG